jgi:DNA-binding response OmpR family regulator
MAPADRSDVRVLAVDDAPEARLLIRRALAGEGYAVAEAASGAEALESIRAHPPDVVLLDVNMGDMSGLEVLASVRRLQPDLPVILVTGMDGENDRVLGLDLGADDYLVKPFSVRELAARIRSVTRRSGVTAVHDFGDLVVRPAEREVALRGDAVNLTAKEFDLLAHLAAHPRRVFTREELLQAVWGSSEDWQDPATVTEHVRRLRKKLEDDPEQPARLRTVRGVGYRFEP